LILHLHKLAKAEIRAAATWYRGRGESLDRRFLAAVWNVLEKLETDAHSFAKLETQPTGTPFRRVRLVGFPYLVIFEVAANEVFVYAVAHASRQPNYWRRRKRPS
jgi:hypothetical protein